MAQVSTRAPAPAQYLVRIIHHIRFLPVLYSNFNLILIFFVVGRNECDPDGTGSLDREAFARGMVRIDEELRRAQVLGRAGSSAGWSAASAARALRPVPSRPILR